jgi:hypothetical protein
LPSEAKTKSPKMTRWLPNIRNSAKPHRATLHSPLLPSAFTLAFTMLHDPVHIEYGDVCHSYTSTTGADAELDGLLDALALQLTESDADAEGVVLLPNDGDLVPVLLIDCDLLTLRDGDHDILGEAGGLTDKLSLSLGLGVLDGLEVTVPDAEVDEEGAAVMDGDTTGVSDKESVAEVDCVDDAVKDAELEDVMVAVSLGVVENLVGVTLLVTDTVLVAVAVRDTVGDLEIVADWEMVGVRERVSLALDVVDSVDVPLVELLSLALGGGVPTKHHAHPQHPPQPVVQPHTLHHCHS